MNFIEQRESYLLPLNTESLGGPGMGRGYSLGKLLLMCGPRRECPPRRIAKKAPNIGAKFEGNPPIKGKNWIILRKYDHF